MKRFGIILVILFFVASVAAIFNFVSAQEPPKEKCVPGTIQTFSSVSGPFRCNDFSVYKCANNFCGKSNGAMEQGVEWYMCETTTESWSDGCESGSSSFTSVISGPHGPDQIQSYGAVPDFQVCPTNYNSWSTAVPVPACSGSCYPAPNLKSLNDSGLLPKNVSEDSKYKLPVNFSWENNVETEVAASPNFCAVGSYEFSIVNPPLSQIVKNTQLQNIEDPAYKLGCRLKSNNAYQWKARACLDEEGDDCGEWAKTQNFETGPAPELVLPYDQDWTGDSGAKDVPLPASLDWCDVEEANSLLLKIYIMQGGQKVCHPNLLAIKDGKEFCDSWIIRKERRDIEQAERTLFSDFLDEALYFFTKNTSYWWETAACTDDSGQDCKNFSQQWNFTTGEAASPPAFLTSPVNDPSGQRPVGLPLVLDWRKDAGINSWRYKIDSKEKTAVVSQSRSFDYPELSLNTIYKWQVLSCPDYEAKECQDPWSEIYTFKTTGQAPNIVYPAAGQISIPIPINFDWEDVSGAESYVITAQGDGWNITKNLTESSFSADFPEFPIKQETNYTWQVKTCAKENGQTCGIFSAPQTFRTFRISPPQNPSYPQNGGMLFTDERFLSWEQTAGAKAYQYQIKNLTLSEEESDEACLALAGKEVFAQPKKASGNSDFAELKCLGQYQWQVRSCLDENCQETSNWSDAWTFALLEGGTGQGGLVPCGRAANDPDTPWNEREPCQIKHLFLSVKIIIDFLLLRIMPAILVLLTIATAVIFYTSLGQVFAMTQVISLWKAAGIGLGLIFFAWLIVNLFLGLVGFNVGVFGDWYEINL